VFRPNKVPINLSPYILKKNVFWFYWALFLHLSSTTPVTGIAKHPKVKERKGHGLASRFASRTFLIRHWQLYRSPVLAFWCFLFFRQILYSSVKTVRRLNECLHRLCAMSHGLLADTGTRWTTTPQNNYLGDVPNAKCRVLLFRDAVCVVPFPIIRDSSWGCRHFNTLGLRFKSRQMKMRLVWSFTVLRHSSM